MLSLQTVHFVIMMHAWRRRYVHCMT